MQSFGFILKGPPVAWHRPMQMRNGHTYKHQADTAFQSAIAALAAKEVLSPWDLKGDFSLAISFFVHDLRRRDLDNLIKNLCDGLNGIAFKDDTQVAKIIAEKHLDRQNPRTVVEVRRLL